MAGRALAAVQRVLNPAATLAIRWLDRLALALTVAGFAWLLLIWGRMVVSPAPQEMREGAMLIATMAVLDGQNPYALATLPGPANVYGILFPLLAAPFCLVFGTGLPALRLANGLGIAIATLLLYRACRRQGAAPDMALLGSAMGLAGWLYWVTATARPDGVALALMMGALSVIAAEPFRARSFAWCLVLSLLAFSAKIYFVYPAFFAAAWVFLQGRFLRGIVYGAVAGLALLATMLGLGAAFPGWLAVAIGANLNATGYDVTHLLRQCRDFVLFSLPLLLAALVPGGARPRLALPDFWGFTAIFAGLALALQLGGHPGAFLTYFFHLLSPPLIVLVTAAAGTRAAPRRAMLLAFPVAFVLNAHLFPWQWGRFAAGEAAFGEAARLIGNATRPLGTTEFAPLLALAGHTAYENGHSEYFSYALAGRPPFFLAAVWPPRAVLEQRNDAWNAAILGGLEARRFDLVLANPFLFGLIPRAPLAASYARVGGIELDMPWGDQRWTAGVWRPSP